MSSKYPFEKDWPVEGFPIDHDRGKFVQIRAVGPIVQGKPPYKGYPEGEKGCGYYKWWEVQLSFRPYNPKTSPDGSYVTVTGKSGRTLKERWVGRCIARFKTEAEAFAFTHKLHQSEKKAFFWNE